MLQRRGTAFSPRLHQPPNRGIEVADYATGNVGAFSLSTFRYAGKPIYPLPAPVAHVYDFPVEKNWSACRSRFLWLGSNGLVHKGLDLVLDAFANMPDCHLTVCTSLDQDPEFKRAYHRELYELPNIDTVGWVEIGGVRFREISSPYAAAKWASTGYAKMFRDLYGLDVTTLRVYMVYGPGQVDLRKLIPYVIISLLRGESPVLGGGQRPVDWIYVDDVVDAFIGAITAKDIGGEILDVGSGQLVTVRGIVERLGAIIRPEAVLNFGVLPDRPLEQVNVADNARTLARLHWHPKVPIDDGLRQTVEWYRKHMPKAGKPDAG